MSLLSSLPTTSAIIFVNRVNRANKICDILKYNLFDPVCIHSQLKQQDRIKMYDLFKISQPQILVATDLYEHSIYASPINIVINYDLPIDK